ncbi:hypothetical protein CSKR_109099 [Clonorchis sinensis]|uniref:Uncharacterized protein n=1 Tax=Clonorchis sinensis TaxID=79923 RepID=A0A419PZH1_CLOSI|nr:hypothetical protein CSKR_109099 [Clonorchis sinensis]
MARSSLFLTGSSLFVTESNGGTRWLKWLDRKCTDRKVRGSNPASATRLPLSRLGQPGSIPALVLPSKSMAARHRKSVTAGRFIIIYFIAQWYSSPGALYVGNMKR